MARFADSNEPLFGECTRAGRPRERAGEYGKSCAHSSTRVHAIKWTTWIS